MYRNTNKWGMSHMNDSWVKSMYGWVMSHTWVSHVSHMDESWHKYEWVMSVMGHIWMIHVSHMNESCHPYKWDRSHICMSHVSHMDESWHKYKDHIWMTVEFKVCDSYVCAMTHPYVRHDSSMCETWLIHMWDMTHTYICETWLIHTRDMTHPYVRHDT